MLRFLSIFFIFIFFANSETKASQWIDDLKILQNFSDITDKVFGQNALQKKTFNTFKNNNKNSEELHSISEIQGELFYGDIIKRYGNTAKFRLKENITKTKGAKSGMDSGTQKNFLKAKKQRIKKAIQKLPNNSIFIELFKKSQWYDLKEKLKNEKSIVNDIESIIKREGQLKTNKSGVFGIKKAANNEIMNYNIEDKDLLAKWYQENIKNSQNRTIDNFTKWKKAAAEEEERKRKEEAAARKNKINEIQQAINACNNEVVKAAMQTILKDNKLNNKTIEELKNYLKDVKVINQSVENAKKEAQFTDLSKDTFEKIKSSINDIQNKLKEDADKLVKDLKTVSKDDDFKVAQEAIDTAKNHGVDQKEIDNLQDNLKLKEEEKERQKKEEEEERKRKEAEELKIKLNRAKERKKTFKDINADKMYCPDLKLIIDKYKVVYTELYKKYFIDNKSIKINERNKTTDDKKEKEEIAKHQKALINNSLWHAIANDQTIKKCFTKSPPKETTFISRGRGADIFGATLGESKSKEEGDSSRTILDPPIYMVIDLNKVVKDHTPAITPIVDKLSTEIYLKNLDNNISVIKDEDKTEKKIMEFLKDLTRSGVKLRKSFFITKDEISLMKTKKFKKLKSLLDDYAFGKKEALFKQASPGKKKDSSEPEKPEDPNFDIGVLEKAINEILIRDEKEEQKSKRLARKRKTKTTDDLKEQKKPKPENKGKYKTTDDLKEQKKPRLENKGKSKTTDDL